MVPYKAETVITQLVCGSYFFMQFFFPILKALPFSRGLSSQKIVSHDRFFVDLHILFYQSCDQYFVFWPFQSALHVSFVLIHLPGD